MASLMRHLLPTRQRANHPDLSAPTTTPARGLGWLHGPAWRVPAGLDGAVEGWWRLPVRLRMLAVLLLVAVVVGGIVHRTSRSPWGPPVEVAVATTDATAGQPVAAEMATRPSRLVPDDAVASVPDGRLTRDIGAGEVLTDGHVADDLSSLLVAGEVAIALDQPLPPLPNHAALEVLGLGLDGVGQRLATARLVTIDDPWAWIAIDRADAPAVVAALNTGGVSLVLASRDTPAPGS